MLQGRAAGYDRQATNYAAASIDRRSYSPLTWQRYFDEAADVRIGDERSSFRLYRTLSSSQLALPYVVLLLHGGGQSSLSWAVLVAQIKRSHVVLAHDFRGHGDTHTSDDDDISTHRLVADTVALIRHVYPMTIPPILLCGHSLGGAIAIRIAADAPLLGLNVIGAVCIDVVEGTALGSIEHIAAVIKSRPTHFESVAGAVEWTVRVGAVRNVESARVSVPPTVIQVANDTDALSGNQQYTWRTELSTSRAHWRGWFDGLSAALLSCRCPKLLVLASADRLDQALMTAQMQGRLQVEVVAECGHQVMEDRPVETARILDAFIRRHCRQALTTKTDAT